VTIARSRRFYLLKRLAAKAEGQLSLASFWQARQEEEPGWLLSSSFPSRLALEKTGYTTMEDVAGADQTELRRAGLSSLDADAVILAVGPLF